MPHLFTLWEIAGSLDLIMDETGITVPPEFVGAVIGWTVMRISVCPLHH